MHVQNDAISLFVAEAGDPDAPPVLLLHGITSTHHTWDWFVPALAERYRVLALDFRGHGESDRAPGAYRPADYVADARAVLEQATGGRRAAVVGHSLGAVTAIALAQHDADRLVGVALEDPPIWVLPESAGASLADTSLADNSLVGVFQLVRESAPQVQAAGVAPDALAEMLGYAPAPSGTGTFAEVVHPDVLTTMAGALLTLDATVLDPVLDGSITSFADLSVPLRVPALLLAADPARPDAAASPAAAARLAEVTAAAAGSGAPVTPQVDVEVVTGAGHLIHDELAHRDALATRVLAFLERVHPA